MILIRIVLTADRSLMSTYSDNIYIGFLSCLPNKICPEVLFNRFCPPIPANSDGTTTYPILALRTVESICVNAGFQDTKIAHPDYLDKVINSKTKIVGVSCEDPLGIGPATTSWSSVFNGIPHNRIKFVQLMKKIRELKEKFHFKVILGGPGCWQFNEAKMKKLGIDYLLPGEGERSIPPFFQSILDGEAPSQPIQPEASIPNGEEILPILGPTNSRFIEISRGCGRGCKFCGPTTSGQIRNFLIDKIIADAKVYLKYGIKDIVLQSEDTLRYGSTKKDFSIDIDIIINLYETLFALGLKRISITHASLINFAEQSEEIVKFTQYLHKNGTRYFGCQPGIETGSPRLMRKYMKGKCYPRSPEEWQEIVFDALQVMNENRWYPVCTLILGLPDEEDYDILLTIELIQKIDKFPALYIPLFFVPMSMTSLREREKFVSEKMTALQWKLLLTCWKHNIKYIFNLYKLGASPKGSFQLISKVLITALKFLIHYKGSRMVNKKYHEKISIAKQR
ncbi:MAG: B12-binding domain-containing radical SAM protein [Promethearchaeota archaeon]